jgi:hypothetical protein
MMPEANRPGDQSTTKSIKKSISMHADNNPEASNQALNELRWGTFQLSQLTITGTIPVPIGHWKSHHQQYLSWSYYSDALESRPTSAIICEQSSRHRQQLLTQVHQRIYASQPCEVHRRRIRVELRDTHNWHLVRPLMAIPIAITFYRTRWSSLCYWLC